MKNTSKTWTTWAKLCSNVTEESLLQSAETNTTSGTALGCRLFGHPRGAVKIKKDWECTVQWQIFPAGISLSLLQRMWLAILSHYTRTHSKSEAGDIILTFSDAVAILVPCRFKAIQLKTPSWAGMSTGGFSVLARSTICTCPVCVPGNASRELLLFGQRTQRPERQKKKKE